MLQTFGPFITHVAIFSFISFVIITVNGLDQSPLSFPSPSARPSVTTSSSISAFSSTVAAAGDISNQTSNSTESTDVKLKGEETIGSASTNSEVDSTVGVIESENVQESPMTALSNTVETVSSQATPSPDTEFIPIKEWKRRKLQDIQHKINQYTDDKVLTNANQPDDGKKDSTISDLCSLRTHVLSLLKSYPSVCSTDRKIMRHRNLENDSSQSVDSPNLEPLSTHQPSELIAINYPSPTTVIDLNPSIPDTLEILEKTSKHLEYETGGGADWTDVGSISTSRAIQKFVKSLKDVSDALSSSPPVTTVDKSKAYVNESERLNGTRAGNESQLSVNSTSLEATEGSNVIEATNERTNLNPSSAPSSSSKEKPFNFASADAGARLLAASEGTIGAKSILDNNDDKYLLTPCGSDGMSQSRSRWVDVELSEEVILEKFETGNLEYYSSCPKKVAILSASHYPPNQWRLLGMFEFGNTRTLQMFEIQRRLVTRYLRILYLGKQGHEYYCPISVVRAFGKNLIADWKDALEQKAPIPISSGKHHGLNKFRSEDHRVEGNNNENDTEVDGELKKNMSIVMANLKTSSGAEHDERSVLNGESPAVSEPIGRQPNMGKNEDDMNRARTKTDLKISSLDDDIGRTRYTEASISTSPSDHVMSEDDQIVIEAMHGDTLRTTAENDNVFRKVTRMLKMLELNQTLTNQYIDTQLGKFVKAIQALHEKTDEIEQGQVPKVQSLEQEILQLRNMIDDIQRQNWQKDLFCALLILGIGFCAGTFLAEIFNGSTRQS